MRWKALFVLAAAWILPSYASSAGFKEGVKLQAGGDLIDIRVGHLVPCVTDWNGDGKKDLIIGQFLGGKISVCLNTGTDAAPVLSAPEYLHSGAKEISLPSG